VYICKILCITDSSLFNSLEDLLVLNLINFSPYIDTNHNLSEGEGCFIVHVQKTSSSKLGKTVKLQFKITQDERDKELLNVIILSLNCGTLQTDRSCKIITVTRHADIINIIIPFFQKYPLQGVKRLDLADFIKVAELIKAKTHLTSEGLDQILLIKSGMNSGRDHASHSD
jgi:hypothetical protein